MATPIIQSVGSVSGAGTPGQGRNNLVPGETVTLSDTVPANIGATYFWVFDDYPIGTAPVLVGFNTATPSFVVDPSAVKAGSYRVRCTVNGAFVSVEVLAVPLAVSGARIPSFEEETQYDGSSNTKGWHEALTKFMRTVDAGLGGGGFGSAGELLIQLIGTGGRESHNSDTPLVVGAFAFNPDQYTLLGTSVAFKFSIVACCGNTPLVVHAQLYNLTDSQVVTSSVITITNNTAPTKYEATLATGTSAGQIKTGAEKIYECRVYLNAPPGNPAVDTIELFKAELRATFTIL